DSHAPGWRRRCITHPCSAVAVAVAPRPAHKLRCSLSAVQSAPLSNWPTAPDQLYPSATRHCNQLLLRLAHTHSRSLHLAVTPFSSVAADWHSTAHHQSPARAPRCRSPAAAPRIATPQGARVLT